MQRASERGDSSRRAWLLAACVIALVSALMLVPLHAGASGPKLPHLDKLVHLAAWFILAAAVWPAMRASLERSRSWRAGLIVAGLGLWGGAIELLQGLVPSRSPDLWDALADLLGATLGALALAMLEARRDRRALRDAADVAALVPELEDP